MPNPSRFDRPEQDLWEALGWTPSARQLEQFIRLQQELKEWNSRVNLTRLLEGADFWIAQVFDSLWPLQRELQTPDAPLDCIDVGTGGGFPGLAVAIALPGARLTLVDSVGRKTSAVLAMARSLELADRVQVRTERIERTGQDPHCRGQFDRAMARAVASAPVVAEYLVPLLREEGEALLYRGRWTPEDELQLQGALKPLRANLAERQHCELPADKGPRHLLRLRPQARCPATYPRAIGIPAKLPLGLDLN
ncbi:16S rRNA (guanine(527)-N(7))-methyltransferase RsmG [Synechococcus sp. HK01-R]|uniref:16S rRNA (guanine(527)-N(7))-methyltransferase RsmG n=1 Tax=Synechococcus sp. HK01-R TaxID=2751171 RepID=UPI001626A019|nr:16S rRNA (guanine(527)-N(7))-methyltransferase RsmG [Synechococcus sp. HK01-R]QNG27301.1 16S rRNA (guanine(527)-N(7))-methyltransferase RsmG [Synechococcus sp. HK01-R]